VPANDGPRVLVLGCLRDIDSFIVLSEQDIGIGHGQAVIKNETVGVPFKNDARYRAV
jgi:hypothetical protein